jgi:hypothetical protein
MDMQERVAARRAEIERQQSDARAAADDKERNRQAAAMDGIFDGLKGEAAAAGAQVRREGDRLVLNDRPAPPKIDRATMRQSVIDQMLHDAARRRWSPKENWIAIGLIGTGVGSILIPFIGIPLLCFGIWRVNVTNEKYRSELRAEYPDLFAATVS